MALGECLSEARVDVTVHLPPEAGRLRSALYSLGKVRSERVTEQGGLELDVGLRRSDFNALVKKEGLEQMLVQRSRSLVKGLNDSHDEAAVSVDRLKLAQSRVAKGAGPP